MSAAMTVCREKGITRIYIPIWVAFNEAKYSPALLEAAVFHVFIFHVPQNVLRLCTGLFHVLYPDWTERHGLRHILGSEERTVKAG